MDSSKFDEQRLDELLAQINIDTSLKKSKKISALLEHLGLAEKSSKDIKSASDVIKERLQFVKRDSWTKVYTDLSYGRIDIKSKFAKEDDHAQKIAEVVSPQNHSKVSGALFEWATKEVFNYLKTNKPGLNEGLFLCDIKPRIKKFDPLGVDTTAVDDGIIVFKEVKEGQERFIEYNYDCKAYSRRFSPGRHIDKALSYMKEEANFKRPKSRFYGGFIYIASDFTNTTAINKAAKDELDKGLKIILLRAKDIRDLADKIRTWFIDNARDSIDFGVNINSYLDWSTFVTPQFRTAIIKSEQIDEAFRQSKSRAERQLDRERNSI
ncbi:MAG: hypothetical protein ACFFD4_29210 [Candidatus Odinarchaeota archaeon]